MAIPWLVRHSRRTLRLIRQNIALAVGSKGVVMALAIAGHANLWMAIAADVGVSLLVVANALRLLRSGDGTGAPSAARDADAGRSPAGCGPSADRAGAAAR